MTPTEQDKELEQGIDTQILLRTKIRNTLYNHEIGFSMARAGDKTAEQMADELVEQLFDISTKLITADRKRVALEAAIMGAKFGNAAFRQYSIVNPGKSVNLDDIRQSGIEQATEWARRVYES